MTELAKKHTKIVKRIEGDGLLTSLFFENADTAVAFCHGLGDTYCIDASAQTYKADCPPGALMKLPLITSPELVDFVIDAMDCILTKMEDNAG